MAMVKTIALAVVLVSCGGGECELAPGGCDATALAGRWDLGDDFGNCPPYSSRTRLDGGDRPGGQCQVIETGWGGDCHLWIEEVCDVDGAYLHMLTTAGRSTSRLGWTPREYNERTPREMVNWIRGELDRRRAGGVCSRCGSRPKKGGS